MEYVTLHSEEGRYGNIPFGIRIEIASTRSILWEDKEPAIDFANAIKRDFLARTISLDPTSIENAKTIRKDILNLFEQPIYVEEIPNGYCSNYCCRHLPWFIITTKRGRITIGWRKRVLNISWEGSDIKSTADEIFPDVKATKGPQYIHAWGYESAKAYLTEILLSK